MRHAVWLLLPLLVAHCSCQRPPDAGALASASDAAADADAAVATLPDESPGADAAAAVDVLGAVRADAVPPSQLLQRYVSTLLNDRPASDAYWRLAPADDRRAGDAALRHVTGLRTLRVDSDPPRAGDAGSPPRLVEVPVRIRITTDAGTFQYAGTYRLVPDAQDSGWLIQGAQLQPVLD